VKGTLLLLFKRNAAVTS